ncbi:hypothetical protein V8D89_009462 [Ganoderma adspersum]
MLCMLPCWWLCPSAPSARQHFTGFLICTIQMMLVLSKRMVASIGMPKATTNSVKTRTHEAIPKKPSRARAQTEPGDAHQPRASKLRDSETITKSNATKLYRLKNSNFGGIPFCTEQTVARGRFIASMHIYKERDIKRRAWERHGGPEGFNKYLVKLRASHLKKNGPGFYFTQPSTYDDPRGGVQVTHALEDQEADGTVALDCVQQSTLRAQ